MSSIKTKIDNDQGIRKSDMVVCPNCGQKLMQVYVAERTLLRVMCRRCRSYIIIESV